MMMRMKIIPGIKKMRMIGKLLVLEDNLREVETIEEEDLLTEKKKTMNKKKDMVEEAEVESTTEVKNTKSKDLFTTRNKANKRKLPRMKIHNSKKLNPCPRVYFKLRIEANLDLMLEDPLQLLSRFSLLFHQSLLWDSLEAYNMLSCNIRKLL